MFSYPITIGASGSLSRQVRSGNASLLGTTGATVILGGNSTYDDANTVIPDIGFNFPFYGTNYRTNIYVGSNSYITFGFGSNAYSNLSLTNPGRGIFIAAGDRSYQRVYGIPGSGKYTIRFEGADGTSGTAGSPTRVWETTLFDDGAIQITLGAIGAVDGISALTKGTGAAGEYLNFTVSANSSIVLIPLGANYVAYPNSNYA